MGVWLLLLLLCRSLPTLTLLIQQILDLGVKSHEHINDQILLLYR